MLYENYQNKILRLAERIRKFLRILPWILAGVGAVLVVTAAMLAAKGAISGFGAPSSIVYGETPKVNASAFLSSVSFEYSPKGEKKWTKEVPVMPGEYDVRAVSNAAFGFSRQSDVLTFTITPKPVDIVISASRVEYGRTPSVSASLARNDRVICESVIYKDILQTETTVKADLSKTRIVDANGNDVTHAYVLNAVESDVTITPHEITIHVQDATHEYDGKEFRYEIYEITEGALIGNDELQAKFEKSLVDVGIIANTPTVSILNAQGFDVTHHYRINESRIGDLIVTKRPLIITTGSAEAVYSGKALSCGEYAVSESTPLLEGHEIICKASASITNVGTIDNTMTFSIVESATGRDVTDNYSIMVNRGALKVTPRPITVVTGSESWKYDGQTHFCDDYTVSGLIPEHFTSIVSKTDIINAGTKENEIIISVIGEVMEGYTDVTENYEITYEYGTIEVTKRYITISTDNCEWVYDGENHDHLSVHISGDGLVKGQELILDIPQSALENGYSRIKNVGSVKNVLAAEVLSSKYISTKDYVTENYEITYVYGTLTVTRRPITIRPAYSSKIYDGEPLYASDVEVIDGSLALPTHSFFNVTFTGSRTNVYDTSVSRISKVQIIENGDVDVTSNYKITRVSGELNIDPRPIKITSDSAAKIYDGKPLTCNTFSVITDENNPYDIVKGHTVRGTAFGSQTKVGKSDNYYNIESVKIYNGSTNVTRNYAIVDAMYGTLEVKPFAYITVTAASDSKIYDGKPLTNPQYSVEIVEGEFGKGHNLNAVVEGSITKVGFKDNVVTDVVIRDSSGKDFTEGYIISVMRGTLTVFEQNSSGEGGSGSGEGSGSGGSGDADEGASGEGGSSPSANGGSSGESGPPGGGEGDSDEERVYGKIKTDISTVLYLRENSYGVYNFGANSKGGFWKASPDYMNVLADKYSYNYLTSETLKNTGAKAHTAQFMGMQAYMLPYYMGFKGSYTIPATDTAYSTISDASYNLDYYVMDDLYDRLDYIKGALGEYYNEETVYRNFVYKTYLDIDDETLAYMKGIISQKGFDASDPKVIQRVAAYIQNAAKYNLNYNKSLDSESNVAIAFLEEYREGVCVHYATAGTLLFRALGIPARYVEGFMIETVANEYVEIKSPGHAWVEVYMDGIGWVQVEVTGGMEGAGGAGGSGSGNGNGIPKEFEVKPYSYSKKYDGTPLVPQNEIEEYGNLKKLLDMGYTYYVTISGSQTKIGISECTVKEFVLFDPDGNDVTNEFDITYLEGSLKVSRNLVKVYLYEISKYYDGNIPEISEDDYEVISGLPTRGKLVLDFHLPSAEVCEITRSELNTNMDEYLSYTIYVNGEDVTSQYDISFEIYPGLTSKYIPISILPRPITVTTSSATKVYDGKVLTSPDISITMGTLAWGDVFMGEAVGSAIAIGSHDNLIDDIKIVDINGKDVLDNYSVTVSIGQLIILKAD